MKPSLIASRLTPIFLSGTIALTACGKKAEPAPAPTAPAPSEPTPAASDTATSPAVTETAPAAASSDASTEPAADTAAPPDIAAAPAPAPTAEGPDLASFTFGARIVSQSPADSEPQPAWHLLDERPQTWFGGTDAQRTDVSAIVELAAPANIDHIGVTFDVDEIHAKDLPAGLTLEVATSPEGPWQTVTTVTPPSTRHTHLVALSPPVTARYIRLNMPKRLADNYMGPLVGELVVRGAFAESIAQAAPPVGAWNGGWLLPTFDLTSVGDKTVGCFRDDGTPLSATVDGRTVTLRWRSGESSHIALLVPDGDHWRALVQAFGADGSGDSGLTRVEKTDGEPNSCLAALRGETAPKSEIEVALEKGEKAIVYSILFDFDSDRIRPESKPILDEIATILARHPEWKLDIAGHTDSVGSDTYNLTLSERRAKATVTSLIERGVDAARLTSQGLGEGVPLVSNDTATGRAQNRRVELTRK